MIDVSLNYEYIVALYIMSTDPACSSVKKLDLNYVLIFLPGDHIS